jgi:parvulin-like peptidyl-prolyl isomerase
MSLVIITGCSEKDTRTGIPEEMIDEYEPANPADLPEPSGGFVYSIKDETITADEIVTPLAEQFGDAAKGMGFQQFTQQAGPVVERRVLSEISNILVYQQAAEQAGEQVEDALNKAVDSEVKKFVTKFGGDYARAEQALEDMGMNWKQYRRQQRKMIMTQSYLSSEIPERKPITPSEVRNYYEENKDRLFGSKPKIKIQLIDIQPAKLELSDPNRSRIEAAKEQAEQLIARLNVGADFSELAKKHSHGHRAAYGGQWETVNPDSLAEPYDILAEKTKQMQPGDIEGPVYRDGHCFVMKLLEKQNARIQPLNEVREQIRARLELQRRKEAINKINQKIVEQASLSDTDEFVKFCLQRLYLVSNE